MLLDGLARTLRGVALALVVAAPCTVLAQPSPQDKQENIGVFKGGILPDVPPQLYPFILAYSTVYGEQIIPVQEHDSTAEFEVKLRANTYYLFLALDGYERTCSVAEIRAGETTFYDFQLGRQIWITEYLPGVVTKKIWPIPLLTRSRFPMPLPSPLPPKGSKSAQK